MSETNPAVKRKKRVGIQAGRKQVCESERQVVWQGREAKSRSGEPVPVCSVCKCKHMCVCVQKST